MTVPSPCRAACRLSDDRRFCLSCGRLLTDITRWSIMTDIEKFEAIEKAKEKLYDDSRT